MSIVFVCSGNTCRSPMAERFGRRWIAERLKVKEEEIETKFGLSVKSVGTKANEGDAATDKSITAMKKRDYDLTDHKSAPATKKILERAIRIYCMTKEHRDDLLKTYASVLKPDRVCTVGTDLVDPYGGSQDDYEKCADALARAIPKTLDNDWEHIHAQLKREGASKPSEPKLDVSGYSKECKWIRPKETAREEERAIYEATMVSAKTAYCHHFDEQGRHLVLHNLPSSAARKCRGVLYVSLGWSGKKIQCSKARGDDPVAAGHDPCTAKTCAFVRDYGVCPYMKTC